MIFTSEVYTRWFWTTPQSVIIIYLCVFLWHLSTSRLKKVLSQRGHTNPNPRWTFLTWALMVAHEVDGSSLQPSTQHWYMHFAPPTWTLRGCMWASMSSSGAGVAAEEADTVAWPAGSVASGPVDSWRGDWVMVALGARWGFLMGGWDGAGWGYDVTPFRSP